MSEMSQDEENVYSNELVQIRAFSSGQFAVRTAGSPEQPLFCIKDVCKVLNIQNHANKTKLLRDREIYGFMVSTPKGPREAKFCSEPGLYRIIGSVQKNNAFAEKFQDWLYEDVIPSIRKTGSYSAPQAATRFQERQLAIESKRVDIDYLKLLSTFQTSTDPQLRLLASDAIKNSLCDQKAIESPQLRTIGSILKNHGMKPIDAAELAKLLGMRMSNLWLKEKGSRPPKIEVYCNGDVRKLNGYPDNKETWKMIKSFLPK